MNPIPDQRLEPKPARIEPEECQHCGEQVDDKCGGRITFMCGSTDKERTVECCENEIVRLRKTIHRLTNELKRWKAYALTIEKAGDAMAPYTTSTEADAWERAKEKKP